MLNLLNLFRKAEDVREFSAGEHVFREGEPGDKMYVVLEGEVDIQVAGSTVQTASPGDLVGEMALIDTKARSASAVALSDCRLAAVDEQGFINMVQQNPFFSLHVLRVLAERLRQMDSKMG